MKHDLKNIDGTLSRYHLQERGYCFGIQFSRKNSETNLAYIHAMV